MQSSPYQQELRGTVLSHLESFAKAKLIKAAELSLNMPDEKTMRLIDRNGNFCFVDESFILLNKISNWKTWKCTLGQKNFTIDKDGDIWGGSCAQIKQFGNIYDTNFIFSKENNFIECYQPSCSCFMDIAIKKAKKEKYFHLNPTGKKVNFTNDFDFVKVEPLLLDYDINISWYMSTKCNFECWYCPPRNHTKQHSKTKENIELGFNNLISNMHNKKLFLNFLGGEPTLFNELPDWCNKVKKVNKDNRLLVTTNGSRSLNYLINLSKSTEIVFSIHLAQSGLDKLADKINRLQKSNILPIQVQIIYQPNYLQKLKYFLSLLDKTTYHLQSQPITKLVKESDSKFYVFSNEELSALTELNNFFSHY